MSKSELLIDGNKIERTEENKQYKKHVRWVCFENGVDSCISGDEVNEIIEEIIEIMRKHKVTVNTSRRILEDTISSIGNETIIT